LDPKSIVEVVPDRLWYDLGESTRDRFTTVTGAVEELKRYTDGRLIVGHGIGLSLPSAMPIDERLLDQVVLSHGDLGYSWYSEHLSLFVVPNRSVPNAQAGLGLPVVLDHETFEIVGDKVGRLAEALGTRILLENPTVFTPIPEPDMSEPAFFNRLYHELGCGMLLDLHNLYANTINLGISADDYLGELDREVVVEIHLAGGDMLKGFYTDSHSGATPPTVWDWARTWAPLFPNLEAITFEYHESYHGRLGITGIRRELELMHDLAFKVSAARAEDAACARSSC